MPTFATALVTARASSKPFRGNRFATLTLVLRKGYLELVLIQVFTHASQPMFLWQHGDTTGFWATHLQMGQFSPWESSSRKVSHFSILVNVSTSNFASTVLCLVLGLPYGASLPLILHLPSPELDQQQHPPFLHQIPSHTHLSKMLGLYVCSSKSHHHW